MSDPIAVSSPAGTADERLNAVPVEVPTNKFGLLLALIDHVGSVVNADRTQVSVALALHCILFTLLVAIIFAWNHYASTISSFVDKEKSRVSEKEPKEGGVKMEKFKKFLESKKVKKHFKNSGPGVRLSADTSGAPSTHGGAAQGSSSDRIHAADAAAAAAYKRHFSNEPQLSSHQKKIQILAKRELEAEKKQAESREQEPEVRGTEVKEFLHSKAISTVLFTCDLLGGDVALPKDQMRAAIEEFLREQLGDDEYKQVASVMMIYSLNGKEERSKAIEIIEKYLQNMIDNPEELKFQKIRLANKAFKERVEGVKGGRDFLESIGFERVEEDGEVFLVIPNNVAKDTARLKEALEILRGGEAVPLKLYRNTKIYYLRENETIPIPEIPPDFFNLSTAELRKQQDALAAHVERLTTLRTREVRQRDEVLRQYSYKYTLIRARLPDRFFLEGTFGVHEPLSAVYAWLSSYCAPWASFSLSDPFSGDLGDDKESLASCGLVPAAIVHVDFDDDAKTQLRSCERTSFLEQKFIDEAKPFTA